MSVEVQGTLHKVPYGKTLELTDLSSNIRVNVQNNIQRESLLPGNSYPSVSLSFITLSFLTAGNCQEFALSPDHNYTLEIRENRKLLSVEDVFKSRFNIGWQGEESEEKKSIEKGFDRIMRDMAPDGFVHCVATLRMDGGSFDKAWPLERKEG